MAQAQMEDAWEQGYFSAGERENPYPKDSKEYHEWERGKKDAFIELEELHTLT